MSLSAISSMAAAFALGLSLAAPPGPVNILMMNEVISRTRLAGGVVGLGALTADGIFFLTVYSARPWLSSSPYLIYLFPAGASILSYLSYILIRNASSPIKGSREGIGVGLARGYAKGVAIGLTNPLQIGWWISVGLPLATLFGALFAAGFFSGILVWISSYNYMLGVFRTKLIRAFRPISYASAIVLLSFAVYFAYAFARHVL